MALISSNTAASTRLHQRGGFLGPTAMGVETPAQMFLRTLRTSFIPVHSHNIPDPDQSRKKTKNSDMFH